MPDPLFWIGRNCMRCHMPIFECMGSVLARDLIAAMDGKIPYIMVREHCGKCAMKLSLDRIYAASYFKGVKDLNG